MAWISAFGKYLPERIVSNEEIAPQIGAEAGWILEMSGVEERRWARPEETVADMAVAAALDALERGNAQAGDLDLVIVASGTNERRFPAAAAEVQHRLGAQKAIALDVCMASAGALFGIAQAELWLQRKRRALVVASEKMSAVATLPPVDKGTAMLFGDGAGAVLLDSGQGVAEILDLELGSDGANAGDLRLEFGEPVQMNGRSVILHAARKVPAAIETVLARRGRAAGEVPHFLMHQANVNLIAKIARTLGVPPERFFSNIARYGNTSSASLLIAAAEWNEAAGFRAGEPVVMAAFGAGFHWGAIYLEGR